MNAFKRNSFRQKMFKGAVMIMILLQAACAANVTKLGGGPKDRAAPKSSKLAANGSGSSLTKSHAHAQRRKVESKHDANDAGAALTCGFDMPEKVSARPKVQPTTAVHLPQNAQLIRDEEQYNVNQVEETLHQMEEALQQVEEVLNVIELIESWDMLPGAKKVLVGTTITGAVIGGLVAHQSAKDDESNDPDFKDVIQGVVTGAVVGAEVGNAIMFIGGMIVFMVSY